MNKLIIAISGVKLSGKTSMTKFILSEYINHKIGQKRFILEKVGKETLLIDSFNNNQIISTDYPNEQMKHITDTYSAKIYSFADPLKKFCIDVLGLDMNQCYGSDDDKNSQTHILWDDIPSEIREKYSKPRRGSGINKPASGYMTGREVMQVFGTDICRKIDQNCWARGLYSTIKIDNHDLSIISDARFPNEVTMGTENGAKVIRLTRKITSDDHPSETALKNFALGEYSLVIHNEDKTMSETHKTVRPHIFSWFEQRGLI